MITQEKPPLRAARLSGGLALLAAFFIVAVALPNTDKITVDRSTYPPRTYMEPQPFWVCYTLAITFIPALCIFLFGKRWPIVEVIGWIVLGTLLTGMIG